MRSDGWDDLHLLEVGEVSARSPYGPYGLQMEWHDSHQGIVAQIDQPSVDVTAGAVGNRIDYVGSAGHVPGTIIYAAADELVQVPSSTAMEQALAATDNQYVWEMHGPAHHLLLRPAGRLAGGGRLQPGPAPGTRPGPRRLTSDGPASLELSDGTTIALADGLNEGVAGTARRRRAR